MPEILEVIKREIVNTENSIKYFDTHIDFINDLKINKPELEIMFENQSYDETIKMTKKSKDEFICKLNKLKKNCLRLKIPTIKKLLVESSSFIFIIIQSN